MRIYINIWTKVFFKFIYKKKWQPLASSKKGGVSKEYVAALQHGPFSLHIKVEGLWPWKTWFLFHTVQPLDDFQKPFQFHNQGPWFSCKLTLKQLICTKLWSRGVGGKSCIVGLMGFYNLTIWVLLFVGRKTQSRLCGLHGWMMLSIPILTKSFIWSYTSHTHVCVRVRVCSNG